MAAPYPVPNITSFTGIFETVNEYTSNVAMPMVVLIIVLVSFILLNKQDKYSMSGSLLYAFTIGFILSSMLWAAGLLEGKWVVTCLLLVIACGILNELDKR